MKQIFNYFKQMFKNGLNGLRFVLAGVHKGQSNGPGVASGPSKIIERMMKEKMPHYPIVDPVRSHKNIFTQHAAIEMERQNSPGCDIVLGGDHSLSMGSASATLKEYPDARLIWIDAHADLNTWSSSLSGNMHGMPVASLFGLLDNSPPLCSFKDVLYLGLRDLDQFEKDFLHESKIASLSSDDITKDLNGSIHQIKDFLKESPTVHLSIDIDVLDPSFVPGTGTPVKNGLTPTMLHRLVDTVISRGNVVCVDLVEYNPDFDHEDERTLNECIQIIHQILEGKTLEWYEKDSFVDYSI